MLGQRLGQNITLEQWHATVQQLEPWNSMKYLPFHKRKTTQFEAIDWLEPCSSSRSMPRHGRNSVANLIIGFFKRLLANITKAIPIIWNYLYIQCPLKQVREHLYLVLTAVFGHLPEKAATTKSLNSLSTSILSCKNLIQMSWGSVFGEHGWSSISSVGARGSPTSELSGQKRPSLKERRWIRKIF